MKAPNLLTKFTTWATSAWNGYDAAETRTRRYNRQINLQREDKVLRNLDRDRVVSNTRALKRNAVDVAWAIRKHLDYVSTFTFRSTNSTQTDDDTLKPGLQALDDAINASVREWSKPENCDVTGRHSLSALTRLNESCAVTDGDCFTMLISDGSMQLIEGDRVRNPTNIGEWKPADLAAQNIDFSDGTWINGVQISDTGKPLRYAICDRLGPQAYVLRSIVSAKYIVPHGYFERYDATRGVSPLASALNTFCDLYEAREYALAKMKLAQIFALKMTLAGDSDQEAEPDPSAVNDPNKPYSPEGYKFNFGDGPQSMTLQPGDDAEFLESHQPSNEFQAFFQSGLAAGLKALDIPFSFYDEAHSTYSGSRQALVMYEQSAELKRQRLLLWLNAITRWRISLAILDGELTLPDGVTVEDLHWDWVHAALPWIDPVKEANAQAQLLANSTTSRQRICKENGQDFWEILEEQAEESAAMKAKGLVDFAPLGRDNPTSNTTTVDVEAIADAVAERMRGAA